MVEEAFLRAVGVVVGAVCRHQAVGVMEVEVEVEVCRHQAVGVVVEVEVCRHQAVVEVGLVEVCCHLVV